MWGIEPKEKTFVLWSLGMGLDLLIVGLLLQWKTKIFTAVHTAYRQFGLFFVLLTGWIYTLGIYVTEVLDYSDMARLGLNVVYIALLAGAV
jgi:membrane protease subunit (stomatin/prohibitin family)